MKKQKKQIIHPNQMRFPFPTPNTATATKEELHQRSSDKRAFFERINWDAEMERIEQEEVLRNYREFFVK